MKIKHLHLATIIKKSLFVILAATAFGASQDIAAQGLKERAAKVFGSGKEGAKKIIAHVTPARAVIATSVMAAGGLIYAFIVKDRQDSGNSKRATMQLVYPSHVGGKPYEIPAGATLQSLGDQKTYLERMLKDYNQRVGMEARAQETKQQLEVVNQRIDLLKSVEAAEGKTVQTGKRKKRPSILPQEKQG